MELAIILFLIIYPEIYYGLKTLPKTRRGILTEVVTTRGRNNTLHASTVCEYSHESCKLPRFWTQHSAGLVKISKTCWLGNAHLKCDHVNNQAKDLWKKNSSWQAFNCCAQLYKLSINSFAHLSSSEIILA